MGDKTFPTTKEGLYTYLLAVIAYLILNKTRLLITDANMDALSALYGAPDTQDTYLYYYTLWADEAKSRTKTVITSLTSNEKKIKKLLSAIYNDIPDSVWIDADRDTLHRKTGLPIVKTDKKTAIKEQCFCSIELIGGGKIQLRFKSTTDASRASLPELADGVMIASTVSKPLDKEEAGENELKYIPLKGAEEAANFDFHSKASFELDFGSTNTGNYLQFFARWTNSKHPELAGPWTGPNVISIP